jgi:hypothetical protein
MEVHDVSAQGLLPVELHAFELPATQALLQPSLGIGHVPAQPSGERLQSAIVGQHARMRPYFRRLYHRISARRSSG